MNKRYLTVAALLIVVLGGVYFFGGGRGGGGEADPASDVSIVKKDVRREVRTNDADSRGVLFEVPEFRALTYEGEAVTEADLSGKAAVVNTWASWCPFCVDELPDFAALQKEFPDRVRVVAINRAESLERAQSFTDKIGISSRDMTLLLDERDSFYRSIGGFTMPETLFINSEGGVVIHKRGFMTLEEMRRKVEEVLATENNG